MSKMTSNDDIDGRPARPRSIGYDNSNGREGMERKAPALLDRDPHDRDRNRYRVPESLPEYSSRMPPQPLVVRHEETEMVTEDRREKYRPRRHASSPPRPPIQTRKAIEPTAGDSSSSSSESERDGRTLRSDRKKETFRTREREQVHEVFWDLERTKDVTFHLELDVTDDFEPDLDELSRLNRLGKFREAETFFRNKLEQYLEHPYVFVQYAQMLMEMGDYKNFKTLKSPCGLKESPKLHSSWKLIEYLSFMRMEGISEVDRKFAEGAWLDSRRGFYMEDTDFSPSKLGSIECQTLNIVFRISEYMPSYSVMPLDIGEHRLKSNYENLLRHGRIWDFRDILVGAVLCYGERQVHAEIFGTPFVIRNDLVDKIILDWAPIIYNESSNLAILDILTSMAFYALNERHIANARYAVNKGAEIASSIIQNNPSNLKSRQYIRWILAKIAAANYPVMFQLDFESNVPGYIFPRVSTSNESDVPLCIYVPIKSETVDWTIPSVPTKSSETLRMVLEATEQLGDYQTKALCLKQLIPQSRDRISLFDQLIQLQKANNDRFGWLETCLSKYIVCQDEASRDSLREEIYSVKDYEKFGAKLVWARHMVLRALAQSHHEAQVLLEKANGLFEWLSTDVVEFMRRNDLVVRIQLAIEAPASMEIPDRDIEDGELDEEDCDKGDPNADTIAETVTLDQESLTIATNNMKSLEQETESNTSDQIEPEPPQQQLSKYIPRNRDTMVYDRLN